MWFLIAIRVKYKVLSGLKITSVVPWLLPTSPNSSFKSSSVSKQSDLWYSKPPHSFTTLSVQCCLIFLEYPLQLHLTATSLSFKAPSLCQMLWGPVGWATVPLLCFYSFLHTTLSHSLTPVMYPTSPHVLLLILQDSPLVEHLPLVRVHLPLLQWVIKTFSSITALSCIWLVLSVGIFCLLFHLIANLFRQLIFTFYFSTIPGTTPVD